MLSSPGIPDGNVQKGIPLHFGFLVHVNVKEIKEKVLHVDNLLKNRILWMFANEKAMTVEFREIPDR